MKEILKNNYSLKYNIIFKYNKYSKLTFCF